MWNSEHYEAGGVRGAGKPLRCGTPLNVQEEKQSLFFPFTHFSLNKLFLLMVMGHIF